MLPCVCSVMDHRRPRVPLFCFDVIFDLLLNRRTATWNLFVKKTADEARSAELAIIISYPTSNSGMTVLLK